MAAPAPAHSAHRLKNLLLATDAIVVAASWAPIFLSRVQHRREVLAASGATILVALVSLLVLRHCGLYLARVCSVHAVEISRLARASMLTGAGMLLAGSWTGDLSFQQVATGSALAFCLLALSRCIFASWLRARRIDGHFTRPIVIVGDNEEARELQALVRSHRDLGFEVAAMAGSAEEVRPLLDAHSAQGVIVAVSALRQVELNALIRDLLQEGVHVVLSSGLLGIDHHRLRAQPFAREPLFYVERPPLSRAQLVAKRGVDIVGASTGLVISLPVLLLAAIAIKLQDGGPVLFRHQRIGRHGRPFTLYKFRTMVPDAERQLSLVQHLNERRNGPLFKASGDPRVTSIGRLLRATSIDELPQLFNVLRGSMSLVGPRPALTAEASLFDEELLARHSVRPGITGLWQVEARESPSFESYRRLDLFYIENLSLSLDLVILLDTVTAVITGAIRAFTGKRQANPLQAAAVNTEAIPLPLASGEG